MLIIIIIKFKKKTRNKKYIEMKIFLSVVAILAIGTVFTLPIKKEIEKPVVKGLYKFKY